MYSYASLGVPRRPWSEPLSGYFCYYRHVPRLLSPRRPRESSIWRSCKRRRASSSPAEEGRRRSSLIAPTPVKTRRPSVPLPDPAPIVRLVREDDKFISLLLLCRWLRLLFMGVPGRRFLGSFRDCSRCRGAEPGRRCVLRSRLLRGPGEGARRNRDFAAVPR